MSKIASIKPNLACVTSVTVVVSSKKAETGPVADNLGSLLSGLVSYIYCYDSIICSVMNFVELSPINQSVVYLGSMQTQTKNDPYMFFFLSATPHELSYMAFKQTG